MNIVNPNLITERRNQNTLKESISFSGLGIHTGQEVKMKFCPAPMGTGIVFRRVDLPGQPLVPAHVNSVTDTLRSTTIGSGDVRIHTVEHVLAAVNAFSIDNLYIEVSNLEPPIGNGSSDTFVEMIEKVGVIEQSAFVSIIKIEKPIQWSEGDIHIVALPYDGYRISYTLHYPESKVLGAQFHSILVNRENFCREIAPCRTFSRYEEVSAMMDRGLIKGGSLANSVVIHGDVVFSKGGLFFPDEMVRHKILDMVGDLSLIGIPFHAHILAIRAGHASNYQFAKKLHQYIMEKQS